MFEVWMTQGQGECKGPEFPSLREAYDYVKEHLGEGSFAIKNPDGSWAEVVFFPDK